MWEPRDTRGHGLPSFVIANCTSGTSQVKGHWETQQEHGTWEEGWDLWMLGWWEDKSPGIPLLGVPPWKHQLELFLCHCTVSKLIYGARHTRLCYGKPGVEAVRKPVLAVWVGDVQESSRTHQVTGATPCEGAPAPAVTVSGVWSVTARVSQMVKLGSFLNTNVTQIPTPNAYFLLKNIVQVFICFHGVLSFCNAAS